MLFMNYSDKSDHEKWLRDLEIWKKQMNKKCDDDIEKNGAELWGYFVYLGYT